MAQNVIIKDRAKSIIIFWNNSLSSLNKFKKKVQIIVSLANQFELSVTFSIFNLSITQIWNNSCCHHFMDSCNRRIDYRDEFLQYIRAVESSTSVYKCRNNSNPERFNCLNIVMLEN